MMDVAREAECSQSSVSLVLNDVRDVRIGADTRERIRRAAKKLGYKVSVRKARGRASEDVIAFIIDRVATSPEAVVSIDGARELAWENGALVIVASTLNDPDLESRVYDYVLGHDVTGFIHASIMTREVTVPDALVDRPAVLLNCYTSDRRLPSVVPGEVAGGHTATARLIRSGHRRIGFINGEEWMEAAEDRFKGYRQALASADLPFDEELYRAGDWQLHSGDVHTRSLMALADPPTAIFCANDRMAVGCYQALASLGLRIPDDVSVIGYDDEEVARQLTPQLTTVVLPHREMGRWAVEYLFNHAHEPASERYPSVKLECPLVERHSVAAPPRPRRGAQRGR